MFLLYQQGFETEHWFCIGACLTQLHQTEYGIQLHTTVQNDTPELNYDITIRSC